MKSNIIPGKKVPYLQLDTIDSHTWSTDDHLNKKIPWLFLQGIALSSLFSFFKTN